MGDTFGALPLPSAASDSSDPALDAIGSYLTACLVDALDAAWLTLVPSDTVCKVHHLHDPNGGHFQDEQLPCLFLWRGESTGERLADEYEIDRTTVTVLWIPPPLEQDRNVDTARFANAIGKALQRALYLGRDPAWYDAHPGDTAPQIADKRLRGSLLMERANLLYEPRVTAKAPVPITIEIYDSAPRSYFGYRIQLLIVERLDASTATDHGAEAGDCLDATFYVNPDQPDDLDDFDPETGFETGEIIYPLP